MGLGGSSTPTPRTIWKLEEGMEREEEKKERDKEEKKWLEDGGRRRR